jgi:hypothetical protein
MFDSVPVEEAIPIDMELKAKIEVTERMIKFGHDSAESKKRMRELLSGYKKQLSKLDKKPVKKNG